MLFGICRCNMLSAVSHLVAVPGHIWMSRLGAGLLVHSLDMHLRSKHGPCRDASGVDACIKHIMYAGTTVQMAVHARRGASG